MTVTYRRIPRATGVLIAVNVILFLLAEIISGMCCNGIAVTGLQEFDYDISGGFPELEHQGFPLSMIIQGRKAMQ